MPLDRGTIDQQLQALGDGSRWWDQRELRDLPTVLDADERILAIARGKIARIRLLRRSWLIVATNQRLLCIRSGSRTSWRQLSLKVGEIQRVALRVGPLRGRVLVVSGGSTYRLLMPRTDAYRMSTVLSSLCAPTRDAHAGGGPTVMVRRVVDHVLSLPAAALNPNGPNLPAPIPSAELALTDQRVQMLEDQIHELQRQVDFLEQLLRERHAATPYLEEARRG